MENLQEETQRVLVEEMDLVQAFQSEVQAEKVQCSIYGFLSNTNATFDCAFRVSAIFLQLPQNEQIEEVHQSISQTIGNQISLPINFHK